MSRPDASGRSARVSPGMASGRAFRVSGGGFLVAGPEPRSASRGRPSRAFTVTPDVATTGTVTPSDGGAGGAFTPTSLSWSGTGEPQTFTYTPPGTTAASSTAAISASATGGRACSFAAPSGRAATPTVPFVAYPVPAGAVHLTQSMVDAAGGVAYFLGTASATYVLDEDITVGGTGFAVTATGVTLDLGGKTLTYGNDANPVVPNGGFESGTGGVPASWDLSGAPGSQRIAHDAGFSAYGWAAFGPWKLSVPARAAGSADFIKSAAITLTKAGREHAASAVVLQDGYSGTEGYRVEVLEVGTDRSLATSAAFDPAGYPNASAGYYILLRFTPDASAVANGCYLRITFLPGSSSRGYLVGDVVVELYGDMGVSGAQRSPGNYATHLQDDATFAASVYASKAGVAVRNGRIASGRTAGAGGYGVFPSGVAGVTLGDLAFTSGAQSAPAIGADFAGDLLVDRCYFDRLTRRQPNRQQIGSASVIVASDHRAGGGGFGPPTVRSSVFRGYHQVGISLERTTGATVADNSFDGDTLYTDNYAIYCDDFISLAVTGNVVRGLSRGMNLDAVGVTHVSDGAEVSGNDFHVAETMTMEFGRDGSEATALRVRCYESKALRNVEIHDNTFRAYTSPSLVHAALGARITIVSDGTAPGGAFSSVTLRDNLFEGMGGADLAAAVSVPAYPNVENSLLFSGNTYRGDRHGLWFGDNDASQTTVKRHEHRDAIFAAAAVGYIPIRIGASQIQTQHVSVTDATYTGGAAQGVDWTSASDADVHTLYYGVVLTVQCRAGGSPLGNAAVAVSTAAPAVVASALSDATTGDALVPAPTSRVVRTGGTTTTGDPRPLSVAASKAGLATSTQSASPTADATITANLT